MKKSSLKKKEEGIKKPKTAFFFRPKNKMFFDLNFKILECRDKSVKMPG